MQQQQGRSAERVTRFVGVAVVFGLFVAACLAPALARPVPSFPQPFGPHSDVWQGWTALVYGWIPPLTVLWSANVLLVAGWGFLISGRARRAWKYGSLAFVIGLTTWLYYRELFAGYYLWQASMLALVLFGLGSERLSRICDATAAPPTASVAASGVPADRQAS